MTRMDRLHACGEDVAERIQTILVALENHGVRPSVLTTIALRAVVDLMDSDIVNTREDEDA